LQLIQTPARTSATSGVGRADLDVADCLEGRHVAVILLVNLGVEQQLARRVSKAVLQSRSTL
jgi:hypothetical protein